MPASSPAVASSNSTLKPRRSAQRIIIRSTISAQSWASVPPAPALTVTSASPASYLPENRRSSSSAPSRVSTEANASSSSDARSGSSSAISTRPSRSSASDCSLVNASSLRCVRVCSALVFAAVSGSSQKPGAPIADSSACRRSCRAAGSKVVREQGHLLADAGQPLRGGLGCGRGGHADEASGAASGVRKRAPRVLRGALWCVKSDEARVPLALLVLALGKVRVPDVALDLGALVLGEALLDLAVLGEALLVTFDLRVATPAARRLVVLVETGPIRLLHDLLLSAYFEQLPT